MSLISETAKKLNYQRENLKSLLEVDTSKLSKSATHYINDEIERAELNISYFERIMKVLEDK